MTFSKAVKSAKQRRVLPHESDLAIAELSQILVVHGNNVPAIELNRCRSWAGLSRPSKCKQRGFTYARFADDR
jgi:hypothetical protein